MFGYFLFVWLKGRFRKQVEPVLPETWPMISVVVPCFNEEDQIAAKFEDVLKLDYPPERLEVVFADGGSTDQTFQIIEKLTDRADFINAVQCPCRGKINQLNHILPSLKGSIVVNTDADARVAPDALKWIAAEFNTSSNVWVVGAYCRPNNSIPVEKYYWSSQNKGRFMENDAGSSSIVLAPCYAFRKRLLSKFPEDVVADDVYIAFLANALGYRTIYSRKAMAVEKRSPENYEEFIPHKFRKSNAFLRESLRFIYRLPDMTSFCKMMLVTRISQQILTPWLFLFWILLAGVLLMLGQFDVLIVGNIFLGLLFVTTSRVFSWTNLPDGPHNYPFFTIIKGYIPTFGVMLLTGLSYPFFKQGSSYQRMTMNQTCSEDIVEKKSSLERVADESIDYRCHRHGG